MQLASTFCQHGDISFFKIPLRSQKSQINQWQKTFGLLPALQSLKEFILYTTENFKNFLQSVKDKNSKLTLAHPWFGPFNANQWFWLLGMQGGIHLKQIREKKVRKYTYRIQNSEQNSEFRTEF